MGALNVDFVVPEPSVLALIGCGGIALFLLVKSREDKKRGFMAKT